MNLTSASSTLANSGMLSTSIPSLKIPSKPSHDQATFKSEKSSAFSKSQGQQPFFRDLSSVKYAPINEEPDLIMLDSVKKPRPESQGLSMLTTSNLISNQLSQDKGFKTKRDFQPHGDYTVSAHMPRTYCEDQLPSKRVANNMQSYYPKTFRPHPSEKEIVIDLEEDSTDVEKEQANSGQPSEPLVVPDSFISSYAKNSNQMLQQMMLRNLMGQMEFPMQRQADPAQRVLMAQIMQMNQINQMNQRGYMSQLEDQLPYYNRNPMMGNPFQYNMRPNPLARQANFPFGLLEQQDLSLLNKRPEPQGGFENSGVQDLSSKVRANESGARKQTEIILLDDEEISIKQQPERRNNKESSLTQWPRGLRRKVFTIERTVRKPPVQKKRVFKIIRGHKRPYFIKNKQYEANESKKSFYRYSSVSVSVENINQRFNNDLAVGTRKSRRLRESRGETTEGPEPYRFNDVKQPIEDYVIKLHIDENEKNEDVSETPIGEDFQVQLVPFSFGLDIEPRRIVKSIWNPENVDHEAIKERFKKIESKFSKEIVNLEVGLRTLVKFEMNTERVIEELEANKIAYRSFFEIRQKVLKSRVLHHHHF